MPTYEYLCTTCDNHWEEVQRISADALEVCPKCGKSTAKRQISAGNFILKGGGWYADLYSSSPKKTEAKSDAAATPSAAPAKAETAAAPAPAASPAPSGGSGGSGTSGSST